MQLRLAARRLRLIRTVAGALVACLLAAACGPSVTVEAGYQPPVIPVKFALTFAIHADGSISFGGSVGLVTDLGTFSIGAGIETSANPKPDETILIIRHRQSGGKLVDSVYRISTGEEITAIINGQTVLDVFNRKFIVDASHGHVTSIVVRNAPLPKIDGRVTPKVDGPVITRVDTYQKGALIYISLYYVDQDHDAEGFGFVGAYGSGWAEEAHPFSNPSYGLVGPGRIDYPFNSGCGTSQAYSSYVKIWIFDTEGVRSRAVIEHLACTS